MAVLARKGVILTLFQPQTHFAMAKLYLALALLFASHLQMFAQNNERPLRFAAGDFFTGQNITNRTFSKTAINGSLHNGQYYVLVTFARVPNTAQQTALQQAGVQLQQYIPDNAYMATVSSNFDFATARRYNISSINLLPVAYKLDKRIAHYMPPQDKDAAQQMAIHVIGQANKTEALQLLRNMGAVVIPSPLHSQDIIFVQPDTAVARAIATLPFVDYIHLQSTANHLLNHNSVGAQAVSGLQNGKGLFGKGVTIGVGDDADVSTHIDFTGRLINRASAFPNDHGTHVMGTAAGGGLFNPLYRGMAPKATIVSQIFNGILFNTPSYITDHGMVLTNNSYYTGEQACPGNSVYDINSRFIDAQTLQYNQLLHIVASGNDGSFTCGAYPPAFATIKSGWQCAKNVLTVGAAKIDDYTIAPFSSRGPVRDGRLKPELVANGWAVSSTFPNNNYAWYFGTSMAAPQVTGALSLIYERYRLLNGGANPSGALVKAVTCNTAEDLGNPGPDFTYGFGLLNARRAMQAIEDNRYFTGSVADNANASHTITVPAGARRIKILLYWMDKEALPNAATSLVNDLDMTVTGPGLSQPRLPMVLNALPDSVNRDAKPGVDHINNIEQVIIDSPQVGTFTVNIQGYDVPFGPQSYVLTYEIVNPSVTVEYPYGGETWVPSAQEVIRWNAYGNEANTFTVEYSDNNGASWTTLSNSVPADARSYVWTTGPTTPTDSALIRVSRNGTALTGQSTKLFVVLAQPVVTATNVCEGAIQLSWAAVTNATGYDIMQLLGDSMQVIGSTASLSYVVKGLTNTGSGPWLAVRAKTNNAVGRRSVVATAPLSGGPCTLADFDNDVTAVAVVGPTTGREYTSTRNNVNPPISLVIKNLDDAAISGPMTASYSSNGGPTITENISPTIPAGGSFTYTFIQQQPIPLSGGFTRDIKAWVTRPGDGNNRNDTVNYVFKLLSNNFLFSYPVIDNFETTPNSEYKYNTLGLEGNDRFDFSRSTTRGRLRTFVNTGFAHSGSKALTLDQAPASNQYNADTLIATYNMLFGSAVSSQYRYDFYYRNHSNKNRPGNKVWIRGFDTCNWIPAYDLYANQAPMGEWKFASINVNDVLASAVPPQSLSFSSSFQVKFGQEGQGSATNAVQTVDYEDGYTFDDLRLTDAVNDISLVNVVTPENKECGHINSTPVTITVKNYSDSTQYNIAVSYRVNNGTVVTETIPSLTANQTLQYTFSTPADITAFTHYTFDFWLHHAPDSYRGNDTLMGYSFFKAPLITSFPYLETFESNDGHWYTNGNNSSWEWGSPAKTVISKAANGNKAWTTSVSGRYKDNEFSYLVSPCFDVTGMTQPVLSFSHIFELEDDCTCDFTWVEYSTDGGETWQQLGDTDHGINWYDNDFTGTWQASQKTWHVASYDIPVNTGTVRFRFVMFADGGVNFEGVGIDDVHVFDKQAIYAGSNSITTGLTQTVSGNNWIHFVDGNGKRIASLQPQGQNLGSTSVQVHPYTGPVRFANQQYYANLNIVVQPTVQPTVPVRMRLYFTDSVAKALLAATGCIGCGKPNDPYELGITQYTGPATEENGTLSDNANGAYRFHVPDTVAIVPYDNGYYAEFAVDSFSEFWLSKASIEPPFANHCTGDTITYTAAVSGSTYQWQEDSGSGFTNITGSAQYIGVGTNTLKLVALPTNYTGRQYRCLVNGVPGNPITLRFTKLWSGTAGTDWSNPGNWGCGIIPDQFTDVVIPTGLVNYPTVGANTAVRLLRIQAGASVNVATGVVLDVKGQ